MVSLTTRVNDHLKKMFKDAGINRVITYKNNGEMVKKPLYEIISSHFARHTFATKKMRELKNVKAVSLLIGDAPTMVENTYAHPTREDNLNLIRSCQEEAKFSRMEERNADLRKLIADIEKSMQKTL